ncbi:MAG: hypothetical protein HQ559_04245 [Lentisphaerae bacterium]|nr:hypothetical protein [Lentisphaerota bacterium]
MNSSEGVDVMTDSEDRLLRPIKFGVGMVNTASEEWGFNCGPGALCAVLHMTPEELRPHMGDFESKEYTNPRLMRSILRELLVRHEWLVFRGTPPEATGHEWPEFGLVRIQWDGPWCRDKAPMVARYRHTHWIAHRVQPYRDTGFRQVFDVNATCAGGWIPYDEWADKLVPWLLEECEPKANGQWWVTHAARILAMPAWPSGGVKDVGSARPSGLGSNPCQGALSGSRPDQGLTGSLPCLMGSPEHTAARQLRKEAASSLSANK